MPEMKLEAMAANGKESVRFSRDIAPVHGRSVSRLPRDGNNPGGALRMDTFNELLIGGNSGLIVLPGKPATSLLFASSRERAANGCRKESPPLSADVIAKFEKWIAEGAHFDAPNPKDSLEMVADSL